MTPADLRAWQAATGLTAPKAAAALGVSYATYRDWLAGTSRTTGKPITLPPMLGLACAALAAGLEPWTAPVRP
jgi:hypothetical protein